MNITRRNFLTKFGIGALATAGLFAQATVAQTTCSRVSGAGSNNLGPFEPVRAGADPVFLIADMGFDETFVFCKVTTNFAPFKFQTARLGIIDFGAHEFFMDMHSVSIDSLTVEEGSAGPVANYTGILRSETRVFSGEKLRTYVEEHVAFGCLATQLNETASIEISRTNFVMTARFDPAKEHAAIFGDQATFAGRISRGNIVIVA
jgi:hypothetical protein